MNPTLFGVGGRESVRDLLAFFDLFHNFLVYPSDRRYQRCWSRSNFLFPFPRLMTFAVRVRRFTRELWTRGREQEGCIPGIISSTSLTRELWKFSLFVYINNTAPHPAFSRRGRLLIAFFLVSIVTKFKSCFESSWGAIHSIYTQMYIAKKKKKVFRSFYSSLL